MGLDMYLVARRNKKSAGPLDFAEPVKVELHYWRKHPNLHGYFEKLYMQRGGEGEFNCKDLKLTEDDCHQVIAHTKAGTLPDTRGSFFGQSLPEHDPGTILAMEKAIAEIRDGNAVIYSAWY